MRSVGPALLFLPFEVDLLAPLFFSPTAFFFLPSFCLVFFFFSFLTRAECSFPPFLQPLFSSLSARRPPFLQGACVCLTSYRKKKNVRVRARLSLLLAHFISSLFFNDSYIYIYTFVDYAAVTTWVMLFLLLHLLPFYNCNDVWINLGATAEVNQSQCLPARVTLFYILFFFLLHLFFSSSSSNTQKTRRGGRRSYNWISGESFWPHPLRPKRRRRRRRRKHEARNKLSLLSAERKETTGRHLLVFCSVSFGWIPFC